jgi:hypothetical protein
MTGPEKNEATEKLIDNSVSLKNCTTRLRARVVTPTTMPAT